jgi:putative hydrolase of the HAD superfamily
MILALVFDFNGVLLNKNTHQMDLDMLELLKELHDLDITIHLFSNTSKEAIYFLDSKFDFLKYFKNIILVEDTGFSKPSNESFENLLKTIQTEPEDIVYIDDNRNNIRQANKFGMKGVLFINEAKLRAKLIEIAENDN